VTRIPVEFKMGLLTNLKHLKFRKRGVLPFVAFFFLVVDLVVETALVKRRQVIQKEAADTGDVAELRLMNPDGTPFQESNPVEAEPGDSFEVDLYLDPNEAALEAVDVVLGFSHDLLRLTGLEIVNGGNFGTFARLLPSGDTVEIGGKEFASSAEFDSSGVVASANTGGETEGEIRFSAMTHDYETNDIFLPQTEPLEPFVTLNFEVKNDAGGMAYIQFGDVGFSEGATNESNAVVGSASGQEVRDVLSEPNTSVAVAISVDITLPASVVPEGADDSVMFVPIQVTITPSGQDSPVYDQEINFTRDSAGDPFVADNLGFDGDPGEYEIKVKGPAHLSLSTTTTLESGENNLVDFSQEVMLGGDINGDDKVMLEDAIELSKNYRTSDPEGGDITMDGEVTLEDAIILSRNYRK